MRIPNMSAEIAQVTARRGSNVASSPLVIAVITVPHHPITVVNALVTA